MTKLELQIALLLCIAAQRGGMQASSGWDGYYYDGYYYDPWDEPDYDYGIMDYGGTV